MPLPSEPLRRCLIVKSRDWATKEIGYRVIVSSWAGTGFLAESDLDAIMRLVQGKINLAFFSLVDSIGWVLLTADPWLAGCQVF